MPFWNPPSRLLAPGPSPAMTQQSIAASAGMPQAKQITGHGHSPTHQQTGCLKIPGAHSCPWTWSYSPESPGHSPIYQYAGTIPRNPRTLQPEMLGHCSTHQWAGTSPRIPSTPVPPTSKSVLSLELASCTSGQTTTSRQLQSCSL